MDSIIDGIVEAQTRLLKEHIRANCVIVDHKYIQLKKRLCVGMYHDAIVIPPMIGGLRVFFDDLPEDTAFIVMESYNLEETEFDRLRRENRELKEQLRKVKEALGMEVEE